MVLNLFMFINTTFMVLIAQRIGMRVRICTHLEESALDLLSMLAVEPYSTGCVEPPTVASVLDPRK